MATFSSTSERLTIDGTYKSFVGGTGNSTTVINYASGDAPASGDAGRFLLWQNGSVNGNWEVRFIESATATTVTVTDGGFSTAPPNNANFVISTNLQDVVDGINDDTVIRQQGSTSFQIRDRDFALTGGAFLADVNKSFSSESKQTGSGFIPTYPIADGCVLQFGRLIGGEKNDSVETIGGCQLHLEFANNTLLFTNQGGANDGACILNFYGCLVESLANGGALPFIRAPGPLRIIGCIFDGPMGGRLYSRYSELVSTRFSGNTAGGIAWSLGGTFDRPIDDAFFFQNNTAIKAFEGWQGVFTNVTFAESNTKIIDNGGAASGLLFKFIDCTTFDDSKFSSNKGQYEQLKSVNYFIAEADGTPVTGAKVAIYDNTGLVQDGGVESSSNGTVPTINCRFFRRNHGTITSLNLAPFSIRCRDYGFEYLDLSSAVDEPIKQEIRLRVNAQTVATFAQASATTGINIDFVNEVVTITEDHDVQSLYDYYQFVLQETGNMQYGEDWTRTGDQYDLGDWDMVVDGCTYTGSLVTTGVITTPNGGFITGVYQDQNGTVLPPQPYSITNISPGSRVRIFNTTTGNEIANQIVTGSTFSGTYSEGTTFSDGDTITVTIAKEDKLDFTAVVGDTGVGWTVIADQKPDTVYESMFIDGSTVTKFSADYTVPDITLLAAQDFTFAEFYAWYKYNLNQSAEAMRTIFGALVAEDEANFRIITAVANLFLDNDVTQSVKQTDNRRIYRDTGSGYPVKEPTTSGYGIDVVWQSKVFVASSESSPLTEEEKEQLEKAARNSGLIPALL